MCVGMCTCSSCLCFDASAIPWCTETYNSNNDNNNDNSNNRNNSDSSDNSNSSNSSNSNSSVFHRQDLRARASPGRRAA